MDRFELAKSLLLDFKKYVKWIHRIAQGSEYDMTEGHARLCDKLQEYAEGRNKKRNLMVNVSPGFGKSLLIQYFITWCFARSKHCMFCYIAYGERLIKKLSRESRNLMMMPEWEDLFGKEMDPGDKSVLNYHLISGGVRSGLTAGTISSAILGLDAATYYIKETQAPTGYNLLLGNVNANINAIYVLEGDAKDDKFETAFRQNLSTITSSFEVEDETSDMPGNVVVTIQNSVGGSLPQTGGSGTLPFKVYGISILAVACGVLLLLSRSKDKKASK